MDEPEYRYIETIVTTTDAQHLVRRCVQAVEAECKVLIAFRLNDMKTDAFIRNKGERAGEPGASLESTLTHIGLIKIDGQQVYPAATASAAQSTPEGTDAVPPADTQPSSPAERETEGVVVEQEPSLAASF